MLILPFITFAGKFTLNWIYVKFTLFLANKETIGTYNLASIILNFAESPALDKMKSSIQFNSKWTLQFINGIASDFQKLLKGFNRTTIFMVFTKLFGLT